MTESHPRAGKADRACEIAGVALGWLAVLAGVLFAEPGAGAGATVTVYVFLIPAVCVAAWLYDGLVKPRFSLARWLVGCAACTFVLANPRTWTAGQVVLPLSCILVVMLCVSWICLWRGFGGGGARPPADVAALLLGLVGLSVAVTGWLVVRHYGLSPWTPAGVMVRALETVLGVWAVGVLLRRRVYQLGVCVLLAGKCAWMYGMGAWT